MLTIKKRIRLVVLALGLASMATIVHAENWPQFRGPNRDGISTEKGLLRAWPEGGPEVLWSTEVGQGYSAAAIHDGKVFFNDYDEGGSEWQVRSVKLDDGSELWRFREPRRIRPNHGITRTVPATDGKSYGLADIAGEKGTVIAFICNHCPYVKAVAGRMAADARTLIGAGVGFAAICSNGTPRSSAMCSATWRTIAG